MSKEEKFGHITTFRIRELILLRKKAEIDQESKTNGFLGKEMKKISIILFLFLLCAVANFTQEQNQEAIVINVEVPVSVYDGREFVDSLTINDFEIFENGIPQKIEALYLFNQSEVSRKEDYETLERNQQRHIYFLIQITDYTPKIGEAIKYFFENVMTPNDTLTIATLAKTYTLSLKALEIKTKNEIANDMIEIIRRDTETGNSNYKALLNSLQRIIRGLLSASRARVTDSARSMDVGLGDEGFSNLEVPELLAQYRLFLDQLDEIRIQKKGALVDFAQELKQQIGRKNIFLFYQREYKPELEDRYLNILMSAYQEDTFVQGLIQEVFTAYNRKMDLDLDGLKQASADSGAMFYFIYSDDQPTISTGIRMREQSEDYYSAFSEMANATGGKVATSFDPLAGFLECLASQEKQYLIYYSPSDPGNDGSFRTITVKLKNLPYAVFHRIGYFATKK